MKSAHGSAGRFSRLPSCSAQLSTPGRWSVALKRRQSSRTFIGNYLRDWSAAARRSARRRAHEAPWPGRGHGACARGAGAGALSIRGGADGLVAATGVVILFALGCSLSSAGAKPGRPAPANRERIIDGTTATDVVADGLGTHEIIGEAAETPPTQWPGPSCRAVTGSSTSVL